ncbi:Guanine nucleotide-binding protein-like 3 [Phlyctochytrium bullatum]|nr:Guanine nucleotide-binding protein-like 3 [Phlyctochytrium bullatum]
MGGVKKPKSKRSSASKQYKIRKKVNEHNRKMRKEARNNPQKTKLKKDPGIPNLFPLKDKLLEQIKESKEREEKPLVGIDANLRTQRHLEKMLKSAESRGAAFEELTEATTEDTFEPALEGRKDNSKKAYHREFQKVVEMSDVILEVLDARDPLGCRGRQVEEYIINSGANKRIVLVLNKIGADSLMQLLKNYCRSVGLKKTIAVGVIGFPNVGKSSVINSLKRLKVCTVGATPGVTKVAQEIYLDKHIKLLDCPGIVFGKATSEEDKWKVLLRNCVKVELIEDPLGAVDFLFTKCKTEHLISLYEIPFCANARDFLIQLCRKKGKLRKGGVPDLESAARNVIIDWNAGKIPYYTIPPKDESHNISAEVVSSWGAEFKLSDVIQVETVMLEKLPSGRSAKSSVVMGDGEMMDVDTEKGKRLA